MIRVAFIIGDYPPEERRLREEVARSFSTAEVEVGILSVKPSPFGGLSPAEIQLVAPYFHAAYLQAEREGYDAAVPLGTLDLGVDGRALAGRHSPSSGPARRCSTLRPSSANASGSSVTTTR